MRRICLFLALFAVSLLYARPGRAATEVQIHLLVMGPGESILTHGGHAALMVARFEDGEPADSIVYNFGDTDWDNPHILRDYLQSHLVFFLRDTGSLQATVKEYGLGQDREILHQRLNFSPAQAAEVARRLKEGSVPGKREYIFHHLHATCSTRILDLLDDVLEGKLRAELRKSTGAYTTRDYQEVIFGDNYLLAAAGDLLVGRMHDRLLDKYDGAAHPDRMSEYLQTVLVPSPSGGSTLVPFADPPEWLVRRKDPIVLQKSWGSQAFWAALLVALVGFGASAYRRVRQAPAEAATVVFWAALVSGALGVLLVTFIAVCQITEFRWNELLLVFWPTDLWLAFQMRSYLQKRAALSTWVQRYTHLRAAAALTVVALHLVGVLYQKPYILTALGCTFPAVAWVLVRALRTAVPVRQPGKLRASRVAAEA